MDEKGFTFSTPEGDVDLTIDQVRDMAAREEPDGLYALAMAYLFGWDVEQDEDRGYELLESAVDKGQTEAMSLMVRLFMQGEYLGIDSVRAAELSVKAAQDGIPEAQLYAGLAYMDGIYVQQDYAEAARYFRLSANQGNQEARTDLAYLYQEGLGVPKDEVKAFRLFRTAAAAGNLNALFHEGICHEFGVGTRQSFDAAADCYRKGSEAGDAFATERLAHLMYEGVCGNPPDPEGAFELFLKAAMEGVSTAMLSVGASYAFGDGVERDVGEARKWLKMAEDNGVDEAADIMRSLGASEDVLKDD